MPGISITSAFQQGVSVHQQQLLYDSQMTPVFAGTRNMKSHVLDPYNRFSEALSLPS